MHEARRFPYVAHGVDDTHALGTFLGVFVPCTSTIFGVVVFLRLGFVVGQAGVWMTLLFILGCFVVCLLTTCSLCALISDGDDERPGGTGFPRRQHSSNDPGVYCALRKAVGPHFGAMLGTAFYLAFVVDVAWYVVGFAENLKTAIGAHPRAQVFPWNPPGTWLTTSLASGALLVLAAISSRVHLTARLSLIVLVAIVVCIVASLLCLLWPTYDPESGPTRPSLATFLNNSAPDLTPFPGYERPTLTLMFAFIFPGFTGVLAGSNLSGHLLAPTRSIARGTLGSLVFVVLTYTAICITLAATVQREFLKSNLRIMDTVVSHSLHLPLGQIGVACTTLSSALSYLLGAPRVLDAVSRDSSWTWLHTQPARSHRAPHEPMRALVLTWALVQLILLTGTVDLLAPLVSGLFLLSFCFLNLLAFVASVSRQSFAPSFACHSKWSSLAGFILAFMAMAWALSAVPEVAVALSLLFVLLLLWQRTPLVRLVTHGEWGGLALLEEPNQAPSMLAPAEDAAAAAERVERAAVCIFDGLVGRFSAAAMLSRPLREVKSRLTLRGARFVRHINMGVYMALSFFERPVWCYATPTCGDAQHVAPTFELWVLPLWASQAVEAVCVLVFVWEMSHKVNYLSRRTFFSTPAHVVQLLTLLLDAAGIAVSAISADTLTFFNPILRPVLFVALSSRTRRALGTFLRVLPSLSDWAGLLLLLLAFYAFLGVMLFGKQSPILGDDDTYFETIPQSLLSLCVLITTSNFPDVMLHAYKHSHAARPWTFAFFCSFLLVGLFFVMNMFLAEIVQSYKLQLEADAVRRRANLDAAIRFAFELLDFNRNGFVELEDFSSLMRHMQRPVFTTFEDQGLWHARVGPLNTASATRELNGMLRADHGLAACGLGLKPFTQLMRLLERGAADQDESISFNLSSRQASVGVDAAHGVGGTSERRVSLSFRSPRASLSGDDPTVRPPGLARRVSLGATDQRTHPALSQTGRAHPRAASLQHRSRVQRMIGARWQQLIQHPRAAELAVSFVLICDAVLLAVEIDAHSRPHAHAVARLRQIERPSAPLFCLVYVGELLAKVWWLGPGRVLTSWPHLFDAAVTMVSVTADVGTLVVHESSLPLAMRIALTVRTLRLLRLLTTIRRFHVIFGRLAKLLPRLSGLFGALWFLFSVYAQFGVFFFGGKLYVGDAYEHSSGSDPLYTYCNFNDFGSAFVTLFELLVVNNWYVIMDEVAIVDGEWSRLYFISWWVLSVLVMSNLLVAFILEEMGGASPEAPVEATGPSEGGERATEAAREQAQWASSRQDATAAIRKRSGALHHTEADSTRPHAPGLEPLLAARGMHLQPDEPQLDGSSTAVHRVEGAPDEIAS